MTNYQEIADIIERRRVFLEDTINYYNLGKRSFKISKANGLSRCVYAPGHDNTTGCAIGRHLPIELSRRLDVIEDSSISCPKTFELIPTWMQEMGIDFLSAIQELHDEETYWNESGISEKGNVFASHIKKQYTSIQ